MNRPLRRPPSRPLSLLARFRAWLGVVLPRQWIGQTVLGLFLVQAVVLLLRHEGPVREDSSAIAVFVFSFMAGGGAYGVFRIVSFHPGMDADYRDWLKSTPWNPEKALPLGPPWLILQDAVLVCGLTLLCLPVLGPSANFFWQAGNVFMAVTVLLFPAIVALGHYLVLALAALFVSQEFSAIYGALFLGAAALISRDSKPIALAFLFGAIVVTQFALRRSLRRFPYGGRLIRDIVEKSNRRASSPPLFPWDSLSPKPEVEGLSWRHALLLPWLVAAWFLALTQEAPSPETLRWCQIFTVGPPLVYRLYLYCWGNWPPISLAGRLVTGRLILPGYDRVFLCPLAAILVGLYGTGLLVSLGATPAFDRAVIVGLQLLCLTAIGPSHRQWLLTGKFRAEPVRTSSAIIRL